MANIDAILKYQHDPDSNYYTLLGCNQLSTVEQITAEYKVRALWYHPDKNPNDPESAEKFTKLQVAKDILTNEESRIKYDKWLNAGVAIPFEVWNAHNSHIHSSLHWANPKPKSMIGSTPIEIKENPKLYQTAETNTSSLLQKFRNYEI